MNILIGSSIIKINFLDFVYEILKFPNINDILISLLEFNCVILEILFFRRMLIKLVIDMMFTFMQNIIIKLNHLFFMILYNFISINIMDLSFWNKLYQDLDNLYSISSQEDNPKTALKLINKTMLTDIFPILQKKYSKEMNKYYNRRNKYNKHVHRLAKYATKELNKAFEKYNHKHEFHIMSSFMSATNLIGESDVDFGLLIDDLDEEKLFEAIKILNELGYKFGYIMNPTIPTNKYYAFEKFIDGIEFEVKIRDTKLTQTVLQLHNYLNTKLTPDERKIVTYAKYILKNLSKENKLDIRAYKLFKTMFYEAYYYYIKNGTLLRDSKV